MNASIGDALILGTDKIEEAIKSMAPTVWEAFLKQQYVEGIGMIIGTILCFAIAIGVFYGARKWYVSNIKDEDNYDVDNIVPFISLLVVGTFIIVIGLLILSGVIGRFINPEYYTIKELITTFKPI